MTTSRPQRSIDELVAEVRKRHFPLPAVRGAVRRIEARIGCALPDDMRRFYSVLGGALLFRKSDAPYEIVEPKLIRPVAFDVLGDAASEIPVPPSWFSICDVQDGNYVAIDLPAKPNGEVWLIDCFHETIGLEDYSTVIALSFSELLERALASRGEHYWLDEHPSYGDAFKRSDGRKRDARKGRRGARR
jgi:cell wall assembly regulator SMI1